MTATDSAEEVATVPQPRELNVTLFLSLLEQRGATTDADRATVCGTDRTVVWRWRTGKTKPSLDQAIKLARLLGVDIEELFPEAA